MPLQTARFVSLRPILCLTLLPGFALWPSAARAAALVNIGVLSFDVLIPADVDVGGVNRFSIFNLTGDFALSPDFRSSTGLTFLDSTFTLNHVAAGFDVIPLGDIGPGDFSLPALEFADTSGFASAVFSATLSSRVFMLDDGTSFIADSSSIFATLSPASGPMLLPGIDTAIITVSGTYTAVPEPSQIPVLALTALTILFCLPRNVRRNRTD